MGSVEWQPSMEGKTGVKLRRVLLGLLLGLIAIENFALIYKTWQEGWQPTDFVCYRTAVEAMFAGTSLFADRLWVWSPLAAPLLVPVAALGLPAWQVLHVAALPLFRDRRFALVYGLSWPFWVDVILGSSFFVVMLAAYYAYRGSRLGSVAYLGLCLLLPRPLMAPLVVWILWHRPEWRVPFVLAGAAELALLAGDGTLVPWVQRLLATAPRDILNGINKGPSALVGGWWIVIGTPLAILLTIKGRIGLAGLAASPYLLIHYLSFGLLELKGVPLGATVARSGTAPQSHAGTMVAGIAPGWVRRWARK